MKCPYLKVIIKDNDSISKTITTEEFRECMYGINGIECAFTTKEEALQYAIDNECFGCDYDYEEIELIQKEEE